MLIRFILTFLLGVIACVLTGIWTRAIVKDREQVIRNRIVRQRVREELAHRNLLVNTTYGKVYNALTEDTRITPLYNAERDCD